MVSWLHNGYPPRNLCPFVRSLLLVSAIAITGGVVALAAVTSLGIAIGYWVGWLHIDEKSGTFAYVVLGTAIIGSAVVIGLAKGTYELVQWRKRVKYLKRMNSLNEGESYYDKYLKEPDEPKRREPNVFRLYLQAVHDKVCPELNIEREE